MRRDGSKYRDHSRITWFGTGGVVAYVDYDSATGSYLYFIGDSEHGGFKVLLPSGATNTSERHGFATIDDAIGYALAQVP